MSQTFVDGFDVAITVDADTVLGLTADSFEFSSENNSYTKSLFGGTAQLARTGMPGGSFSMSGLATQEAIPKLVAADGTDVAFVVTWWSTGDTTSFTAVPDISISASAEGEVSWSMSGPVDGGFTHA